MRACACVPAHAHTHTQRDSDHDICGIPSIDELCGDCEDGSVSGDTRETNDTLKWSQGLAKPVLHMKLLNHFFMCIALDNLINRTF